MLNSKRCILIVDDEKKIVRALSDLLKCKGFEVYNAYDGQTALDAFYSHNNDIDLILLDVMLPFIDGFGVLRQLRKDGETVPVIMLTARGEEYDELSGFNNGADDYIHKPFSTDLLLARIESVLKRSYLDNDGIIKVDGIEMQTAKHIVFINNEETELTPKEFDLLHFLLINKGISLSREQLLTSVWGYDYDGDIRTVDTHIKQLRIKLNDKSRYIQTIHRIGYRFEVCDEKIN